jgi:hypothetical protein
VAFAASAGPEPEASAMLVTEASFAPATSSAPAKKPGAKRAPRLPSLPKEAL